jgi:hypothetical protein
VRAKLEIAVLAVGPQDREDTVKPEVPIVDVHLDPDPWTAAPAEPPRASATHLGIGWLAHLPAAAER